MLVMLHNLWRAGLPAAAVFLALINIVLRLATKTEVEL